MAGDPEESAAGRAEDGIGVSSGDSSAPTPKPALGSEGKTQAGVNPPDVTLSGAGEPPTPQSDRSDAMTMAEPQNAGADSAVHPIFSSIGATIFREGDILGGRRDWQPLMTLVRLPILKELRCPDAPDKQCTLRGTALYLLDSVSTDAQFQQSTPVPDGFAGSTLTVAHPTGAESYVKLRRSNGGNQGDSAGAAGEVMKRNALVELISRVVSEWRRPCGASPQAGSRSPYTNKSLQTR